MLLATILLLSAIAPQAAAGRPDARARTTLAGTNVILAERSGSIDVRLPRPAKITVGDGASRNPDVDFHGKGRVLAVALVQDGDVELDPVTGEEVWGPVEWFSSRWSWCGRRGCLGPQPRHLTTGLYWRSFDDAGRIQLPAGNYTLYVVTDGEPARITVTLNGLAGKERIRPTDRVQQYINGFTSEGSSDPATASARGQNRVRLGSRGILAFGAHQHNPGGSGQGLSGFAYTYNRIDDDLERLENRVPAHDAEAGHDLGDEEWSFSTHRVAPGHYLEQFSAGRAGPSTQADVRSMSLWLGY